MLPGASGPPLLSEDDVVNNVSWGARPGILVKRTRDTLRHKRGKGERIGNIGFGYRLAADGSMSGWIQSRKPLSPQFASCVRAVTASVESPTHSTRNVFARDVARSGGSNQWCARSTRTQRRDSSGWLNFRRQFPPTRAQLAQVPAGCHMDCIQPISSSLSGVATQPLCSSEPSACHRL